MFEFNEEYKILDYAKRTRVQNLSQLRVDEKRVVVTGPQFDLEKG